MKADELAQELGHPEAQKLLSGSMARLAYNGPDGFPRVIPTGFYWTGDRIVVSTAPTSPKVKALETRPEVALTIDTGDTPGDAKALLSPADGKISQLGKIVDGRIFQAKGQEYTAAELLGDEASAVPYRNGRFATIYLSPRDYHRVHAPADARVLGYDYLPGALWSVNPRVAARRDGLLARNERVVIRMHGALGHIALVMVGAGGVGNMRLAEALGGEVDSDRWRAAREPRRVELSGVEVARGDELGAFRLGSTVVVVFEPGRAELVGEIGDPMRFGVRLGRATPAAGGVP